MPEPSGRAGLRGALRSELTKIRSTRSTCWTLLALAATTIAIGALASFAAARNVDAGGRYFDPTNRSLDGLYLGQIVAAALGALTITSEYSTGMIRTSLSVMPRRGRGVRGEGGRVRRGHLRDRARDLLRGVLPRPGADVGRAHQCDAEPAERAARGGRGGLVPDRIRAARVRHRDDPAPDRWRDRRVERAAAGCAAPGDHPAAELAERRQQVGTCLRRGGIFATKPDPTDPPIAHDFSAWTGFAVFAMYAAITLLAAMLAFRNRDA